jgi:hypothetical protein
MADTPSRRRHWTSPVQKVADVGVQAVILGVVGEPVEPAAVAVEAGMVPVAAASALPEADEVVKCIKSSNNLL